MIFVACAAACVAVARILLALYGPRRARRMARVPSGSLAVIVEQAFAPARRVSPPRTRIARGTGSVIGAIVDDETEKIVRPPQHAH